MLKYTVLLASCILVLSGCSLPGSSSETTTQNATTSIEKNGVTMSVPANWTEAKSSDLPIPKQGTIVLAYSSPETSKGFFNNLIVMQDELSGLISSRKYSEVNHVQTARNYLEYTKLQDEAFTFTDADESRLYVFEAKYNQTTPRMKFIQTAKVCGRNVYLIHFSLTLDKNPAPYITLVRSFVCK